MDSVDFMKICLGVDLAWVKCTRGVRYWEHSTGTRAWLFGSVGEASDLSKRSFSWTKCVVEPAPRRYSILSSAI